MWFRQASRSVFPRPIRLSPLQIRRRWRGAIPTPTPPGTIIPPGATTIIPGIPGYTGIPGIILTAGTAIIPTGTLGITMIPGITTHGITARGITVHGTMIPGTTGPITTMATMAGAIPAADTITGCPTALQG